MLIPPADWAVQRDQHVDLLGIPKTAAEFLEPLLANLAAGVSAVKEEQRRGKVEIGADGMLHLPAITALADRGERACTRETIYNLIGSVQFPDMLFVWNARVDTRRRTYAAGIYTHVRDRWGIVYDQPVVVNERQAGVTIEGVEQHNSARIGSAYLCG